MGMPVGILDRSLFRQFVLFALAVENFLNPFVHPGALSLSAGARKTGNGHDAHYRHAIARNPSALDVMEALSANDNTLGRPRLNAARIEIDGIRIGDGGEREKSSRESGNQTLMHKSPSNGRISRPEALR